MRVISLELVNYQRLALYDIKRFHYSPDKKIQLILGTNGSGKSSIVAELSPLPADKNQYNAGGSKKIVISYKGDEYCLTSSFNGAQTHSIVKNQTEELNPGGTITVQRDLVKQIFGYTQEIHNLLTGVEQYTSMSPARRREWFTQISDTNYDYALSVYNKVKERSRDVTGALKLAKKRLVSETAKIISEKQITEIKEQVNLFVGELNHLYNNRYILETDTHTSLEAQKAAEKELLDHCLNLFKLKGVFAQEVIWTPEEYEVDINSKNEEIIKINTTVSILSKEHSELSEKFEAYKKTSGSSIEELENGLNELQEKKRQVLQQLRINLDWIDPRAALQALRGIHSAIFEALYELPINTDNQYSQENLNSVQERVNSLKMKLTEAQSKIERLQHTKEHLESLRNGGTTICPKCSHGWVVGWDEEVHKRTVSSIEKGVEYIKNLKVDLEKQEDLLNRNIDYGNRYRDYIRFVRTYPALNCLWEHIQNEHLIKNSPKTALIRISDALNDLELIESTSDIDKDITKTQNLLELARKASAEDMSRVGTRIEEIEKLNGQYIKQLQTLNESLKKSTLMKSRVQTMLDLEEKIIRLEKSFRNATQEHVKALQNEIVANSI